MTAANIEISVATLEQLFDTLDPLPFREKDLDHRAEDYIVGWARELPRDTPLAIVIHVPPVEIERPLAASIAPAFAHFFTYRAEVVGQELRELLRVGRAALLIGVVALAACVGLAHLAAQVMAASALREIVVESLLILGWVANWRPLEIFLYDWWPLVRRRNLYHRLAGARVALLPSGAHGDAHGGGRPS